MTRKNIAYVRVSTDTQAETGYGIDVQRQRIAAYATAMGFEVGEYIVDDGYSGATLDRPGLRKIVEMIENDEVERVVVYKLDRLSRSLRNLLDMYEDVFKRNGVALVSVSEQFDTTSPQGEMFFHILGSFAQYERSVIKDRLSGGRKAKAAKGERAVGAVPYGYRIVEIDGRKRTAVDETTAPIVKRIFSWSSAGWSMERIARTLNEQGVKAPRGAKWYGSSIKTILENSIYRGIVEYRAKSNGGTVIGHNEALAIL